MSSNTIEESAETGQEGPLPASTPGHIRKTEIYWRARQPWLQERGYLLRPRYRPDWKPSWLGTKKPFAICEDGLSMQHPSTLDATRLMDGTIVVLKKTSKATHPHEAEIGQYLSSEPLAADPHNHCVPILEILQDPEDDDILLLVMPLLRRFNDPRFETIGEAVECFRQLFEGLQFMHSHDVAHRDIMELNVMMDSVMFPELFHPRYYDMKLDYSGKATYYTRTERPTKYYLVDFGLSRKYDLSEGRPQEYPIIGGDRSVPEFQHEGMNTPCDPFPTDIYCMGNLIRQDFIQTFYGLDFMEELVTQMVQDDPQMRPTIDEVVARFDAIRGEISPWRLRFRLVMRREDIVVRVLKDVRHLLRTVNFIARRLPPIPTPANQASV